MLPTPITPKRTESVPWISSAVDSSPEAGLATHKETIERHGIAYAIMKLCYEIHVSTEKQQGSRALEVAPCLVACIWRRSHAAIKNICILLSDIPFPLYMLR